jgi:SNF2 family DNA or RNA helicase
MIRRSLYPHQEDLLEYMRTTPTPGVLVEMRLGKTLTTIRWLQELGTERNLVVGPSAILDPWQRELELEGEDDILWLMGMREKRRKLLHARAKWKLINKEGHRSLPEIADQKWDAVICDESVFLKNPQAQVSGFFTSAFTGVPYRSILTGRPNPESDLDFFQQFKFLRGEMLGHTNFWKFRARFFTKFEGSYEWDYRPGARRTIKEWIAANAFVLRRSDVPGMHVRKVYEQRVLEMPPSLRRRYDLLEKEFLLELEDGGLVPTKYAMHKFLWLRRMAGGFLDGELVWPGKIQELLELLKGELHGESVVVWFAYNSELAAVHRALEQARITNTWITGKTPLPRRAGRTKMFRTKRVQVLLAQVACVQYAEDFSVGDTAIYYSSPVSLNQRMQSEDRIVKMGKKHPAYIDLVTRNSVDEVVQEMKDKKEGRSNTVLRAVARMRG